MTRFASTAMRRFIKLVAITTTLAAALLMPGIAAADTEVYLDIPGIPGGGGPDPMMGRQIFAHSVSWSVNQAVTSTTSSTGTFSGQRVEMSPFVIVKPLDQASVPLTFASARGDFFRTVVITVMNSSTHTPLVIYRLDNVLVSAVSTDVTNGQAPLESVSLMFRRVSATSYTYDPTGRYVVGTITKGWDLMENRAM